jgi:prepilin-type N-terminal cleavage/methylation domain-containing protein/prepilin-type processing-associated H-X9-DG protein
MHRDPRRVPTQRSVAPRCAPPTMQWVRAAFTLIELLVVIAIIAIIAAILFPVFARVREKARQATCLSNEKQIAMGWLMYIQDYDETLPFVLNVAANDMVNGNGGDKGRAALPGVTGQEPRFQLVTLVTQYVKNQAIWYCPTIGPNATCEPCVKVGNWKKGATMRDQGTSYYYTYLSYPFPYVNGSDILMGGKGYGILREPARWPMLGEALNGFGITGNLSDPPASLVPHFGGMNVAYGDGHVKFYRTETADGGASITRHIGDGVFPGQ